MNLHAEVGGRLVPLRDCAWALHAACGCVRGLLVTTGYETEELAWRGFFRGSRERAKAKRDGYRFKLILVEQVRTEIRLEYDCPHRPKPMPELDPAKMGALFGPQGAAP